MLKLDIFLYERWVGERLEGICFVDFDVDLVAMANVSAANPFVSEENLGLEGRVNPPLLVLSTRVHFWSRA